MEESSTTRQYQRFDDVSLLSESFYPPFFLLDDLALLYIKAAHPDRHKKSTSTKQSVVPLAKKFNLDHVHDELRQERSNKQMKRDMAKGLAVPYFKSEWGVAYTEQQKQSPSGRESYSAGAMRECSTLLIPPNVLLSRWVNSTIEWSWDPVEITPDFTQRSKTTLVTKSKNSTNAQREHR